MRSTWDEGSVSCARILPDDQPRWPFLLLHSASFTWKNLASPLYPGYGSDRKSKRMRPQPHSKWIRLVGSYAYLAWCSPIDENKLVPSQNRLSNKQKNTQSILKTDRRGGGH